MRSQERRSRGEKGVSLLLGVISLVFIIPLLGLSIDAAVLYSVKARLQAAVDGASLAAARALNLGQTTAAQAANAQQNAVNWFYANFPAGTWNTSNTVMSQSDVQVFDSPNNPHLRNVTVSATTNVPTYFMRWFNITSVPVSSLGNASRRDVVAMMVLDRSGSMLNAGACGAMITAAKMFTGQFAAGRDYIGLVSFSDNVYLHSSPTQSFQTVLGYSNASGSGTGALDSIVCGGGTSTPQAISIAYNEVYKMNLPGALNVIMFETDGLPNTLTLNFWDSSTNTAALSSTSNCTDTNGKKKSLGGFASSSVLPNWTAGYSMGSGSAYPNVPAGIVGGLYADDPGVNNHLRLLWQYIATSTSDFKANPTQITSTAPGCAFAGSSGQNVDPPPADFAWLPATDVYGNQLTPSYTYMTVNTTGGHVQDNSWTNYRNAVFNATDNAAYRARTNATIPVYFFGIGLGGTSTNPPDYVLMQRMANDPNGDNYNTPVKYLPCAQETNCTTYASQPQGTFIFAPDASELSRAFLAISSQVLRLSK